MFTVCKTKRWVTIFANTFTPLQHAHVFKISETLKQINTKFQMGKYAGKTGCLLFFILHCFLDIISKINKLIVHNTALECTDSVLN